jgi:hypothetical protein
MNHYDSNLSALLKTFPSFSEEILRKRGDDTELSVSLSRSGLPTASRDGIFLHSRFDPNREAQQLIDSVATTGCTVFFGFGLGYYVEAVQRRSPSETIVIIEPNPDTLRTALGAKDLLNLLASENLTFLLDVEPDGVTAFLSSMPPAPFAVVAPRSLTRQNEEYFSQLQVTIDSLEARRAINMNTLNRFGRRWIRNLVSNLRMLPAAKPLSSLVGRHVGTPALLVAAGPSLDSALPLLPALAQRCIVIAVDTSLRAVLRAGVEPDYLVVVDPQYWNARHLDGCATGGVSLITESATYPTVFRKRYRSVYFGKSLFPLGSYLERDLGPFGKLGAGGSVATTAWDIARLLGCSPIYSAGLDLGFPQQGTHFKGGRFEEMQLNTATRRCPAETSSFCMISDAEPFYVGSNSGGQVLTDKRLVTYKWWFENQIKMHPDIACHNLSPNGVRIQGMPYAAVESLLELRILSNKEVRQPAPHGLAYRRRSRMLLAALHSLLEELRALQEISAEGCCLAERLRHPGRADLPLILSSLNLVDEKLHSSSVKDVAAFLVQDVANRIIESAGTDAAPDEVAESSYLMYSELRQAAEYHIKLLETAVIRLDGSDWV